MINGRPLTFRSTVIVKIGWEAASQKCLYSKIYFLGQISTCSILADSNPIFIIQCIGNNAIEIRGHALVALIFQSHDDRGFVH